MTTPQPDIGQSSQNYWGLDSSVGDAIRETKLVPTDHLVGNLEGLFRKSGFTTRVSFQDGQATIVGVANHSMVKVEVTKEGATYQRFNGRAYDLEEATLSQAGEAGFQGWYHR